MEEISFSLSDVHIGVEEEVRRIGKRVIWDFKSDFHNDAYIGIFLVNIIYLGKLSCHVISRHFIWHVNQLKKNLDC